MCIRDRWVGGVVLAAMLKVNVSGKALTGVFNPKPHETYIGRSLLDVYKRQFLQPDAANRKAGCHNNDHTYDHNSRLLHQLAKLVFDSRRIQAFKISRCHFYKIQKQPDVYKRQSLHSDSFLKINVPQ